MYTGDTVNINVTVYDGNTTTPKSLAHATIEWVLYDEATDTAALNKNSTIVITDGLGGQMLIPLLPADTETLTPGVYYHEVEVTDEAGNVSTVTTGHITILPGRI